MEESEEDIHRKRKEKKFEELKQKADQVATSLSIVNKDYTLDDYICFAFLTLMNASVAFPQFMSPTKAMLSYWIEGQLQLEEDTTDELDPISNDSKIIDINDVRNGILPFKKK